MAIKTLESYLFEKGIVGVNPIDTIKNARLGIDVEHYISRLINNKRELFLAAIGGFPFTFTQFIEADLKIFKELNITPVFVFKGSRVNAQNEMLKSFELDGKITKARAEAWEQYYSKFDKPIGSNESSVSPLGSIVGNALSFKTQPVTPSSATPRAQNSGFKSSNSSHSVFDSSPYISDFISLFEKHGVEYMVAPISSWAQLNYFYANGYVDVIYGPTECLLTPDIDTFIHGMEFQSKEFRFIDKKHLLQEFKISQKQFKEIAVVLGFDIQPYSLVNKNFGFNAAKAIDFKWLHEYTLNGNNVYATVLNNAKKTKNQKDLDRFKNGMTSIDFMPILKASGKVEFLLEPDGGFPPLDEFDSNAQPADQQQPKVPNDIHDVIGQRLPHEYFFYQSIGLISSKLLDSLLYGNYLEFAPLDGGNSTQYKSLINSKINLTTKNKMLSLLTSSINRYFQAKKYHYIKYFDASKSVDSAHEFDFRVSMPGPIYLKLAHYLVRSGKDSKTFDIVNFLKQFSDENFLAKVVHSKGFIEKDEDRLQTSNELLSTSLIRSLYIYDFISLSDNKLTKWGKLLNKLAETSEDRDDVERLLLLLVFFKNHSNEVKLHQSLTPEVLGEPKLASQEKSSLIKQYILIITRLSLLFDPYNTESVSNLNSNNINKLNLNLLAYRSIFEFVKTNINELNQTLAVSLLTNNQFNRKNFSTNVKWRKLVDQMILKQTLPSTLHSIIADVYFDYMFNGAGDGDASDKVEKTREFVNNSYEQNFKGVLETLDGSFKFVLKALDLIEEIGKAELIDKEYFNAIKGAKVFLMKHTKL
ncbi:Mkt1 protein [Saccharomycopsis crataegensis]|uniref:Mkt1 protein n=1 Tax=Saccharomycopsis crataegensis TaxID=43959 RepID=A0AAV5QIU9_9ASCO|nr:Mkt1 protein [Saccharomycopsis crataegensis]